MIQVMTIDERLRKLASELETAIRESANFASADERYGFCKGYMESVARRLRMEATIQEQRKSRLRV